MCLMAFGRWLLAIWTKKRGGSISMPSGIGTELEPPEKGFNKGSPGLHPGKDATALATHEVG